MDIAYIYALGVEIFKEVNVNIGSIVNTDAFYSTHKKWRRYMSHEKSEGCRPCILITRTFPHDVTR